ncbi:MAG TPA: twin-arginine translocase subunit TatC [Pirellulaceae bacterium]|nr:twin-arginine translocase subunit TatC [Pirellulaceae bacterium]
MAKSKTTRKANDDLFEDTTMTFGEHLEELRVCLFRSVIGIALGCIVGFFVANGVVRFFQGPLEDAMERYYIDKAITDFRDKFDVVPVEVRNMILHEGMIPESIQVETGAVFRSLNLSYPGQLAGFEASPYWFTAGDFLPADTLREEGAKSLARALAGDHGDQDTPAGQLWKLLPEADRLTLEKLAKVETKFSEEQKAQVAAILNRAAGLKELHETPAFLAIEGPDAGPKDTIQSWIASLLGFAASAEYNTVGDLRKQLGERFDPEASRRLNKILLSRAFPDALHKTRLNLLTLITWRPVKVRFQVLNAQEAFMIWMKAALVTGLVIASPYVFYQIWNFVAAGLYPHEKNYVYLYLPISILLFFGGAALAFVFVFQPVLDFLFLFNKGMNADFDPRIGEWLSFVLILPIGFGLSFQLPLVMLFINRIGLVSVETYVGQWRVAILTICVVAMVLTPADPISMMLMAVPLCALFVLGIFMCKYMPRGRNPFEEAYEP